MHARVFEFDALSSRWSWQRTGSAALALAVHALAILLLAMPAEGPVQSRSTDTPVPVITLIETKPAPTTFPVPAEPQPPVRIRRPPAPVPEPVSEATSVPASADAAAPVAVMSTSVEANLPAENAPAAQTQVTLGYVDVVDPPYPRDAKRRGEQGTVLLSVLVDADGRPNRIDIERSSGSPRLDRAARDAVRQWRFRPVRIDGVAVPARGSVPIAFHLDRG